MKLLKVIFAVLAMSCCLLNAGYAISFADVSIDVSISGDSISVGDTVQINIALENSGSLGIYAMVATNPVVTVQMPPGSSDYSSADCIQTDQTTLECTLAEIGVDEIEQVSISAVLNSAGHYVVEASVDADDLLGGTRSANDLVTVLTQSLNSGPVDLAVEINANSSNEIEIEGTGHVTAVVRNSHDSNTVYFPVVELTMSESLDFYSGDYCSDIDGVLTCKVSTLPPQSEARLIFEVIGNTISEAATFGVTAKSTQIETQSQNNAAELVFSITEWEVLCGASNPQCFGAAEGPNDTEESESEIPNGSDDLGDAGDGQIDEATTNLGIAAGNDIGSSSQSGGGVMSKQLLCLLLLCLCGLHIQSMRPANTSGRQ